MVKQANIINYSKLLALMSGNSIWLLKFFFFSQIISLKLYYFDCKQHVNIQPFRVLFKTRIPLGGSTNC